MGYVSMFELKKMEALAVIVYGVLAIVLPFTYAAMIGEARAVIGLSLTAALVYLYQAHIYSLPIYYETVVDDDGDDEEPDWSSAKSPIEEDKDEEGNVVFLGGKPRQFRAVDRGEDLASFGADEIRQERILGLARLLIFVVWCVSIVMIVGSI